MTQAFDVVVRGAGVVGQTTALLLAQARLRVGLYAEPHGSAGASPAQAVAPTQEPPPRDVRAYALNAASRALLESLRAWPEPASATPVQRMQVWGDEGGALDFSASALVCDALAWIVDVPALQSCLANAVRYQPSITLLSADMLATAQPALTVVTEGGASASRAQRAIEFIANRYPQQAIAARLQGSRPHGGHARQWFVRGPQGAEVVALLPLEGDALALVWSVPLARAPVLLAMDPVDFADALRATCSQPASSEPGALQLCSERAVWPLQRAQASRWVDEGFALVGDAAHTVHPLAGQGLNLGLADAVELARVVAEREYWRSPGEFKLLRRYERARKAQVARMGFVTDALERLFAHTDTRVQALRNWGMSGFGHSGPLKDWVARQAMGL